MSTFDEWFRDLQRRWLSGAILTQEQADQIKALAQSRVRGTGLRL